MLLSCHLGAVLWVIICTVHLTVCHYHVTYAFQSESALYSCLNVKELLARNMRDIWSLSDSNGFALYKEISYHVSFDNVRKRNKFN